MFNLIALTATFILAIILLIIDKKDFFALAILLTMSAGFVTIAWFENSSKLNTIKDYINDKEKIEIIYTKQETIDACGNVNTIIIPVDTILVTK